MNKKILIIPLILFFAVFNIFADEDDDPDFIPLPERAPNVFIDNMTDKEIEVYMRSEYNRSNIFYGELSLLGGLEFYNNLRVKGGISIGMTESSTDIHSFFRTNYAPFEKIPVTFSLIWIYNGIPEYEVHTHSLLPFVTYGSSRAGISAGVNFRFTSFFGEETQFESIFSFNGYVNFLNTDDVQIGLSAGTFGDFYAKNIGAYSLKLNIYMYLDSNWTILNEIELMQSGGDGFSTNFYGFAWRGGARYSW